MEKLKQSFMQLIHNHSAFIDRWGNWIIVLSFVLILGMFFISLGRIKSAKLKAWTVLSLLFLLVILTMLALLVNSVR